MARILWAAIHDTEGIEAIAEEEQQFGFARTQETVSTLVSDSVFRPLPDQIEQCMRGMEPAIDIVFLVRIAALGPAIYRSAKLLDAMHGRTLVPIILFYPGTRDGESSLLYGWTYRNANRPGRITTASKSTEVAYGDDSGAILQAD